MIRRDAGLACIEALAPDQPPCAHRQIRPLQHQGRTLTAEFQCHRGEMCRSPLEHLAANGATAGEKDVIERQGHQRRRDGSIPLVHPNHLRLEVFCNQAADQGRDGWCVFGWLQHRRVSGCKGADQGLKG